MQILKAGNISCRRRAERIFIVSWLAPLIYFALMINVASGASIIVEDASGAPVEIRLPVRRIIPLNSDCLEVIRILRAEDLVAGVYSGISGEHSFWGDLAAKPKIGKWNDLNLEAAAELEPDLVITYGYNIDPLVEAKLKALGIQLLRLNFYKIETIEKEVATLGRVLDREAAATRFCDWYQRKIDMIRSLVKRTSTRPKVYIENYADYQTVSTGTGGHEMCVLAGGVNIAEDLSIPYPRITPEWVVSRNPEMIIKAASYESGYDLKNSLQFDRQRDAIIDRPAWQHIAAVASGNVHVMDRAISAGPRAIVGVAYMACWLHPDLSKTLVPEALHEEYMKTFLGLHYQGHFTSSRLPGNNQ